MKILVIDDEEAISWTLERAFRAEGWQADRVAHAEAALAYFAEHEGIDVALLDVRMPGRDGIALLAELRQRYPQTAIVLMTAFGDLGTAVAAMRGGAAEYLTKPFDLVDAKNAVRKCAQRKEANATPPLVEAPEQPSDGIVGRSARMQEVFKNIALVAAAEVPVLITGESGVGKELVARAIHRHSLRADRPLFTIHLAALSPTLIESELFGHVKGSFTGSDRDRTGALEGAHRATVFFDEAGDIPPSVQVKLLRALEQHEVSPVGDARPRPADFRVITATNCDLRRAVEEGTMRRDFYFRIAGFVIEVPPLRERREDIPALADLFLRRVGHEQAHFSPEALAALQERSWTGNVRELRQAVEHAAIMARGGRIEPDHLPLEGATQIRLESSPRSLVRQWTERQLASGVKFNDLYARFQAEFEPALWQTVLEHVGGNRTSAAEMLGIDRTTLRKKLDSP